MLCRHTAAFLPHILILSSLAGALALGEGERTFHLDSTTGPINVAVGEKFQVRVFESTQSPDSLILGERGRKPHYWFHMDSVDARSRHQGGQLAQGAKRSHV